MLSFWRPCRPLL